MRNQARRFAPRRLGCPADRAHCRRQSHPARAGRHQIPVFLIVSQRGSIDDHRIYQEVQGRRTIPLLQAYDFPYHILDRPDDVSSIPDAFETCRMQKRPFVLFLTRRLVKGEATA
jgi:sulfopyruvate decarboxylase subunit alpha